MSPPTFMTPTATRSASRTRVATARLSHRRERQLGPGPVGLQPPQPAHHHHLPRAPECDSGLRQCWPLDLGPGLEQQHHDLGYDADTNLTTTTFPAASGVVDSFTYNAAD